MCFGAEANPSDSHLHTFIDVDVFIPTNLEHFVVEHASYDKPIHNVPKFGIEATTI